MNSELLFTSASVLDLLASIDELQDKDINLIESDSGVTISIGESTYNIVDKSATDIEVPPEVVDEVDEITTEAFDELETSDKVSIEDLDEIQGGPIKQIAKTLLLGGMLRLSAKLLKK